MQTQNQNIRDSIQRQSTAGSAVRPLAFAPEQDRLEGSSDLPWAALGYAEDARSPAFKALTAAPALPAIQYATWGQGFGDYELRSGIFGGIDIGRKTTTGGGIGGAYATIRDFVRAGDVLVLGAFGEGLSTHASNNDGTTENIGGGGFGFNGIWIRGGFSTDTIVKVDFLDLNTSTVGFTGLGLTNVAVASNLNYKFEFAQWWVEPTVGASYSDASWNTTATTLGFTHGQQVRVQGGARVGASSGEWNGVRINPVLGLFAYSDVLIHGGTLATVLGVPEAPTDEGKVFVQATSKFDFDWGHGWSSYVEGDIRGRGSVFGVAGMAGITYTFGAAEVAPVTSRY